MLTLPPNVRSSNLHIGVESWITSTECVWCVTIPSSGSTVMMHGFFFFSGKISFRDGSELPVELYLKRFIQSSRPRTLNWRCNFKFCMSKVNIIYLNEIETLMYLQDSITQNNTDEDFMNRSRWLYWYYKRVECVSVSITSLLWILYLNTIILY